MIEPPAAERQLPYGVADLFFEQSALKSKVEGILKRTFDTWSYSEIITPTFEYYERLSAEASPEVREQIYRFLDRDGRMMALRADPTIPIARIVGTKLHDYKLPLRFFYVTNVFRYEEQKAARRREFTQAGVELIGTNGAAADAEVIALAVTAFRAVGLGEIRIRLGTMALINALLDDLMLPPLQQEAIKRALQRRSNALLLEVLDASPVRSDLRRALGQLPRMTGGAGILRIAEHECSANENAIAALNHLSALHRYLEAMGCAGAITYDLAMLRGMAYYSGIMFEAFAPGIGSSIMSGGRYDKLLSHFGRDLPALGFAIGVERTLAALAAERGTEVDLRPYALAEIGASQKAAIRIERARRQGTRVELMLSPHSHSELIAFARERGAREVWFCDGTVEGLE